MARSERFSQPPRALSPRYKAQRHDQRMTAFDHQRLAMERLKREENARTKNMEELHAELFNFNILMEVDEYGFPLRTPYAVSDSVPSVYVPPSFETEKKKEDSVSTEKKKEDSVKPQDSPANPPAGAE